MRFLQTNKKTSAVTFSDRAEEAELRRIPAVRNCSYRQAESGSICTDLRVPFSDEVNFTVPDVSANSV